MFTNSKYPPLSPHSPETPLETEWKLNNSTELFIGSGYSHNTYLKDVNFLST